MTPIAENFLQKISKKKKGKTYLANCLGLNTYPSAEDQFNCFNSSLLCMLIGFFFLCATLSHLAFTINLSLLIT